MKMADGNGDQTAPATSSVPDDCHPIDALAEEFFERRRGGEDLTVAVFAAAHPRWQSELEAILPTLMLLRDPVCTNIATRVPAATLAPGSRVADFEILRELGRGGMGVVYEAVQLSLRRRVALKTLALPNPVDARIVARFRREAAAAANLHHTNIVQVFGFGEIPGWCYYAMQLIVGDSLDVILQKMSAVRRRSQLDAAGHRVTATGLIAPWLPDVVSAPQEYFRAVARLGSQVADALDYAHRQDLMHRDIKPANLLVDAQGTIWITDFGLVHDGSSDRLTETGDIVGTLRYMAPERFTGQSLPQSDLYSLGLSLLELAQLESPFPTADRASLIDRIRRGALTKPNKTAGPLPTDLETILLKSVSVRPEDRYLSGAELRDDLRRFLADEPIRARAPGVLERLWRVSRRNPGIVSLVSAVLLLLTALALGATIAASRIAQSRSREVAARQLAQKRAESESRQRQVAEQHRKAAEASFQQAKKSVDDFYLLVSENKLLDVPGTQGLRRELLQSALSYYESFASQRQHDEEIRAEHALTLMRVGVLNGELGDAAAATQALREVVRIEEQLLKNNSDDAVTERRLAEAFVRLGSLEQRPRLELEASFDYFQRALVILERRAQAQPDEPILAHDLADARRRYAFALEDAGRIKQAEAEIRQAETLARAAVSAAPNMPNFRQTLAQVLMRKANLASNRRDFEVAIASARESKDLMLALAQESPATLTYQDELGQAWGQLAISLYHARQFAEIPAAIQEQQRILTELAKQNPEVLAYQVRRAQADGLRAAHEFLAGRWVPALEAFQQSTKGLQRLLEDLPADPYLRLILIYMYDGLSASLPGVPLSYDVYEDADRLLSKILSVPPGHSDMWAMRGACRAHLGRPAEALADYNQALATGQRDWPDYLRIALLRYRVGDAVGYQAACRELLDQQESIAPALGPLLAPVCGLGSGAVADFAPLLALVQKPSVLPGHLRVIGAGILQYRAGQTEAAVRALEQGRRLAEASVLWPLTNRQELGLYRALAELFLSRAHRDLQQPEQADRLLQAADQSLRATETALASQRQLRQSQPWEIEVLCECLRADINAEHR